MFENLRNEFLKIKDMGYVDSRYLGSSSIGKTFEDLIGCNSKNFPIPDYEGVEIKVKRKNNNDCITLFNATPDSYLFEIKRLYDNYGYYDSDGQFRSFMIDVFANKYKCLGGVLFFKLFVDYNKEEVVLNVYKNYKIIDNNCRWSFACLREKIYIKLSYLMLVKADVKTLAGAKYYYYYSMGCYKFKDFAIFLKLIEQGKIRITFKVSTFKSGNRYGQIHDHGTGFCINEDNLEELFDKVLFL